MQSLLQLGAGGGTRTHTPSRITDFESVSSANSDTPAFLIIITRIYGKIKSQTNRNCNAKIVLHCGAKRCTLRTVLPGSAVG